ncbi:MAG TPA: hypothetical protein DCG77_06760 [Sphingobacterium sp.]|nr:hypothetical protein [Sphingobacterium sp.]
MGLNDYLSDTTINSFLQRYKYVFNLYFSEVPYLPYAISIQKLRLKLHKHPLGINFVSITSKEFTFK